MNIYIHIVSFQVLQIKPSEAIKIQLPLYIQKTIISVKNVCLSLPKCSPRSVFFTNNHIQRFKAVLMTNIIFLSLYVNLFQIRV